MIAVAANGLLLYKANYNKVHMNTDHIVLRLAHVVSEDTPHHRELMKFKQEVETKSDGRIEVRIYPNGSLGGDRQTVESTSLGYIQGCLPGSAVLAGFDPRFMVSDLPFIFKTREAAFQAYDNELGEELNKYTRELGLVSLGFTQSGYRHITTNKLAIEKPQDLKGLSIRTMENPIHIAAFKAWGANPTPMSFSELFTALQQGAVDSQENPIIVLMGAKFFEVQDTLSLTGHVFATGVFLLNDEFYDNLSEQDRQIITDAARNYIENSRRETEAEEQNYIQQAKDLGMNVFELTSEQKDVFIEASQSIYELYVKNFGTQDLVDKAMKYND